MDCSTPFPAWAKAVCGLGLLFWFYGLSLGDLSLAHFSTRDIYRTLVSRLILKASWHLRFIRPFRHQLTPPSESPIWVHDIVDHTFLHSRIPEQSLLTILSWEFTGDASICHVGSIFMNCTLICFSLSLLPPTYARSFFFLHFLWWLSSSFNSPLPGVFPNHNHSINYNKMRIYYNSRLGSGLCCQS